MNPEKVILIYVVSDTFDRFKRFKDIHKAPESLIYVYSVDQLRKALLHKMDIIEKRVLFLPKFILHPESVGLLELVKQLSLENVLELTNCKIV